MSYHFVEASYKAGSGREVRATHTHLLFRGTHLLFRGTHLLFRGTHLLFRGTQLLFRGTQLLFRGTQLLFRRVHNAPEETTRRVETYAAHTCVYTVAASSERGVRNGRGEVLYCIQVQPAIIKRDRLIVAAHSYLSKTA
ncbi:MAG: hypothetical protein ICV85_11380 [Tolypothrix sp. T3-bin4]|nr:hypothetical protein [Tolypothrix sp. T3-bin4]